MSRETFGFMIQDVDGRINLEALGGAANTVGRSAISNQLVVSRFE